MYTPPNDDDWMTEQMRDAKVVLKTLYMYKQKV